MSFSVKNTISLCSDTDRYIYYLIVIYYIDEFYGVHMEYKGRIITEKIHGREVTIVGVSHNKEFFDENKYFFDNVFREKDGAVVVESSKIGFEKSMDENKMNFAEKIFIDEEGTYFFNNLIETAKSYGKEIYVIDPSNIPSTALDSLFFVLGVKTLELIKPTRRDFAKSFFSAVLGTTLLYNNTFGKIILDVAFDNEDAINTFGLDDRFAYSEQDYRNASIAKGIEKLVKLDDKNLISFHGDGHSEPIAHYLRNPEERDMKLSVYSPTFKLLGENTIRKYSLDSGWKEVKRTPY